METDVKDSGKKKAGADVKEAALKLLDYRDRSVSELRQRLIQKSYTEEEVEKAIADLTECGLVDDRRFAQLLVRSSVSLGKGRLLIARRLREKGVDPVLAEEVLNEVMEEENERILCLRRALMICGLSGYYEIDENGELFLPGEGIPDYLPALPDPLNYFEPRDEEVRADRSAGRKYRERAKARLARRLLAAGFPSGAVYDAVSRIERL